jgi:hypothetical protein
VENFPDPVTIASHITVTVVFGELYVLGIETIAQRTVESSSHFITIHFVNIAV